MDRSRKKRTGSNSLQGHLEKGQTTQEKAYLLSMGVQAETSHNSQS